MVSSGQTSGSAHLLFWWAAYPVGQMISSLRTIWASPWVRRPALVALAFLGVLVACFFVIDLLGRDAWSAVQEQAAAEGESLELKKLLPPAVPDEENFCAVRPLRNLNAAADDRSPAGLEGRRNAQRLNDVLRVDKSFLAVGSRMGVAEGLPFDLAGLAKVMRRAYHWPIPTVEGDVAADVTVGFAKWDAYFDELTPGLTRPAARWTPSPWDGPLKHPVSEIGLPFFDSSYKLAQSLRMRAAAAAATGDVRRAILCLRCMGKLAEATSEEPLLICGLLAEKERLLMVDVLWELSYRCRGTAEEWEELERLFASLDSRAAMLHSIRAELAITADLTVYADEHTAGKAARALLGRHHELLGRKVARRVPKAMGPAWLVAPRGLFQACAGEVGSRQLQHLVGPLRDGDFPSLLRSHATLMDELTAEPRQSWNIPRTYARVALRPMAVLPEVVYQQALFHQAVIACALERKRLATGSYPASLEGLTLTDGQPIPPDPVSGESMGYRLSDHSRYRLWSVGPDGKDDNGSPGSAIPPSSDPRHGGDWVWSFNPRP